MAEGAAGASPALLDTMISHDFWKGAEWVFLFTGGMTVAYMLKLFVALFVDRHPKRQAEFDQMSSRYMTPLSRAVLVGAAAILPVLGMVPYMTMNRIGDMGQEFFGGSGHVHEVSYFSFANLKGGLISIGIGVLLYAGVVRTLLMEPEAGQMSEGKEGRGRRRRYVDRWPAWLDLENLIYRPLLQAVLPAVFTIVCRVMDHLTDDIVALARKTLCRQLPEPKSHPEGNWLAHVLGSFADRWARMRKRLFGEKDSGRVRVSAVHHLIEKEKRFKHIGNLVEQSFSFGLMLFCIGLCVTLGYLLFVYYGGVLLF